MKLDFQVDSCEDTKRINKLIDFGFGLSFISSVNALRMELKNNLQRLKIKSLSLFEGFIIPVNVLIFFTFPVYALTR